MCDKKFTRKEDVKKHSLIHTGEKPHKCAVFDKRLIQKGQLQAHLLTRTAEKPHKCTV